MRETLESEGGCMLAVDFDGFVARLEGPLGHVVQVDPLGGSLQLLDLLIRELPEDLVLLRI